VSENQIWATIGKTAECLQTNEVENGAWECKWKNAEKLQPGDNPLEWIFIEKKNFKYSVMQYFNLDYNTFICTEQCN